MKRKFDSLLFYVSKILIIVVMIATIYIYKRYDLKWYYLFLLFSVAVSIMLALGMYIPHDKNSENPIGIYMAILVASIGSFWIPSILHRFIVFFIILLSTDSLPALQNHDKKNIPKQEHLQIAMGVIFFISSVYYAVITNGFTRWINIGCAILTVIMVAFVQEQIEGIKEYDKQENLFNSSAFGKNSNHSFDTVLHDKGLKAEYEVSSWLYNINSYHKVLFNVFTPSYKNRFVSEIDAIVISKNGIDLLEVKNQSKKWIINGEGKGDAKAYNQYGTLIAEEQRNPFFQNKIHKENLMHLLNQSDSKLIRDSAYCVGGYVVFGSQTIGWSINNVKQGYCGYRSIGNLIDNGCQKNNYLTDDQIDAIYSFLLPYQNNSVLHREHQRQVGY